MELAPDIEIDNNQGATAAQSPAASSSSKSISSHVIKSVVHQEYIEEPFRAEGKKRLLWRSKCKICSKTLQGNLPKTLKQHLKAFHKETYNKVELLDHQNRQEASNNNQQSSKEFLVMGKLLRMYLGTGVSWLLGEHEDFKALISEINPTVHLPTYKTMVKFSDERFSQMKKDMAIILNNTNRLTVTCDMWSSFHCQDSYIGRVV